MKKCRKGLCIAFSGILLLVAILLVRTFMFVPKYETKATSLERQNAQIDEDKAISDLSEAIKYKTVYDYDNSKVDTNAFLQMHSFIDKSFPNLTRSLEKQVINKYSLLYKWQGQEDDDAIVLMAHMDVVGGETGSESDWDYPMFSGQVTDDYIYGRGTLDIKGQLIGILESIDQLVKEGYVPKKTIYIAIGHDEELGGNEGNKVIAEKLKEQGVKVDMVLDEGGYIVKGVVPKVDLPVALVGIEEKGYVSLKLTAQGKGGHSSMPDKEMAINDIASALDKLKDSPFDAKIDGPTKEFLNNVEPKMPFISRLAISNQWLFKPIILNMLSNSPSSNAIIRTTIAPTIISGGVKDNVIPQTCEAIINFRIFPGETVDSVREKVEEYLKNENVKVDIVGSSWNPSKASNSNSDEYKEVEQVVNTIFPDALVSPYLVVGCTDSRYYQDICDEIFRFTPVVLEKEDLNRLHGVNERISKKGYIDMIQYYYQLVKGLK